MKPSHSEDKEYGYFVVWQLDAQGRNISPYNGAWMFAAPDGLQPGDVVQVPWVDSHPTLNPQQLSEPHHGILVGQTSEGGVVVQFNSQSFNVYPAETAIQFVFRPAAEVDEVWARPATALGQEGGEAEQVEYVKAVPSEFGLGDVYRKPGPYPQLLTLVGQDLQGRLMLMEGWHRSWHAATPEQVQGLELHERAAQQPTLREQVAEGREKLRQIDAYDETWG